MRPNMGWYDANPVHLAELTPSDYAQKLVEYFGDTDAVLEKAKEDFAKGEYQWVTQITNTLVFADPENTDARYLCADADVTWTTKRAGLLSIVQKNAENVAALIEQEGDETCLTRLMDAVTVTSEYKYFNIIEP